MQVLISGSDGLQINDIDSGSVCKTYKGCKAAKQCTVVGSYGVLVTQSDKPILHQYTKKEVPVKRLPLFGQASTLTTDPSGSWLVAGYKTGKISVWSLETGGLYFSQDCHFETVTAIRFTKDGAAMITASADSRVLVWQFNTIVNRSSNVQSPIHTITCHNLPVNDLTVSIGSWRNALCYSASNDNSVAVTDLVRGKMVYTLLLKHTPQILQLDSLSRVLYVASEQSVWAYPLYIQQSSNSQLVSIGSTNSLVEATPSFSLELASRVTSLVLAADGLSMVVGQEDGQVLVLSTVDFQVVRKLKSGAGSVASLHIISDSEFSENELPMLQKVQGNGIETVQIQQLAQPKQSHKLSKQQFLDALFKPKTASSGAETESAQPEANSELAMANEKIKKMQKMYDDLWTRYTDLQKSE